MSDNVQTHTKQTTGLAPRYRVLLLNDDYTPMDFVVSILMRVFRKTPLEANRIMLEGHERGVAVAGVYSFEIAETKVQQVTQQAKHAAYPLRCTLEPV